MGTGYLYNLSDSEFIGSVKYRILHEEEITWWGELTLEDYFHVDDGDEFIIELEDKRMSQCQLKKIVNRATNGVPHNWTYRMVGTRSLE